jgi:hypothetical protein
VRAHFEAGKPISLRFAIHAEGLIALGKEIDAMQGQLGRRAAESFANALAVGIQASLTKGSGKNMFEAFGNMLLEGLGQEFIRLGSAMLAGGILSLNPWLAARGTALIALGASMGAIAANNSGTRTGGVSSGGFSVPSSDRDVVQRITLDPDRGLRNTPLGPVPAMPSTSAVVRPPQPVQFHFTVIGENDPSAQRQIVSLVSNGLRAGYRLD